MRKRRYGPMRTTRSFVFVLLVILMGMLIAAQKTYTANHQEATMRPEE